MGDFLDGVRLLVTEEPKLFLCGKLEEAYTTPPNLELFGFGSGSWKVGNDAAELLADEGRAAFQFKATTEDLPCILEPDNLPAELKDHIHVKEGRVVTLGKVQHMLEAVGVMRTCLIHHTAERRAGVFTWKNIQTMAFSMKSKEEKGKKKKGETKGRKESYGVFAKPITKPLKMNSNIGIAWRMRCHYAAWQCISCASCLFSLSHNNAPSTHFMHGPFVIFTSGSRRAP